MDFGSFGHFEFTWTFISSFLMIILIDLVLAGDNAVVIAIAVRNLPKKSEPSASSPVQAVRLSSGSV